MKKDIEEGYNLEDMIAVLQFELSENMNSRKQKELNYYLFLKEELDRFEYEN